MLFYNTKFSSIYDFGETIPESISLDSLALDIEKVTKALTDYAVGKISPNGTPTYNDIQLNHQDVRGNVITIDGKHLIECQDHLVTRTKDSIKQLLYRPRSNDNTAAPAAISRSLDKWGLHAPAGFHAKRNLEATQENYSYLQILYFFYMMKYFVYYESNFFLQIRFDQISSVFSPFPSSSHGEYWGFIIINALDDPIAAERYYLRDMSYSARIQIITELIDQLIGIDKSPDQNVRAFSDIKTITAEICSTEKASLPPNEGSIDRLLILSYKYQMLAYAMDFSSNLNTPDSLFNFPELTIEINQGWKERFLTVEEVWSFLKDKETVSFCKQQDINSIERADKEIRDAALVFLEDVINYDKSLYIQSGRGLFLEAISDKVLLRADIVALIIKTFYDIGDQYETLRMSYRSGGKKRKNQKLKSALTASGKKATGLIADLAMRLFIVAFRSEYLNAYAGHSYYWPLFKNIDLARFLLIQEIVKAVFSASNPLEWSRRLKDIIAALEKLGG